MILDWPKRLAENNKIVLITRSDAINGSEVAFKSTSNSPTNKQASQYRNGDKLNAL